MKNVVPGTRMPWTRKVAVVGAGGLVAATVGLGAGISTAQAATETLNYTCETLVGDVTFTVVSDSNAPETMEVGESADITVDTEVTVPAGTADSIRDLLNGVQVQGTSDTSLVVDGDPMEYSSTAPVQDVPDTGPLVVQSSGSPGSIDATEEGEIVLSAGGGFVSYLTILQDGGGEFPLETPCTLAEGQDATMDTITVVPAQEPEPEGPSGGQDPTDEVPAGDDGDDEADQQDDGTAEGTTSVPTVIPAGA